MGISFLRSGVVGTAPPQPSSTRTHVLTSVTLSQGPLQAEQAGEYSSEGTTNPTFDQSQHYGELVGGVATFRAPRQVVHTQY